MSIFEPLDRKSTRLNSSHLVISYAVFCLKKNKQKIKKKPKPRSATRSTHSLLQVGATPSTGAMRSAAPSSFLGCFSVSCFFSFFNDTATTEIYTLSLHDALPI